MKPATSAGKFALVFLAGGAVGWVLETVATREPRFSNAFRGAHVPFLPVYGFGATAVAAAAPLMEKTSIPVRFVVYASSLSALELAACATDRAMGDPSWNYDCDGSQCKSPQGSEGCLSWKHALIWGALGLAVDAMVRR